MDRSTYLVQLHLGGNRLITLELQGGRKEYPGQGPSDNKEWTAVSLCRVNEQHSLCW